jgi:small subunit ribosomal protein S9
MADKKVNLTEKAVGRRKTASARVCLATGKGEIVVNSKPYKTYFGIALWQDKILAPLKAVGKEKDLDVSVKVLGGGISAQAEAIRHGIARALIKWNDEFRKVLKAEGFLSRDPRAKERKKFGLHKARRGHQWRKR